MRKMCVLIECMAVGDTALFAEAEADLETKAEGNNYNALSFEKIRRFYEKDMFFNTGICV